MELFGVIGQAVVVTVEHGFIAEPVAHDAALGSVEAVFNLPDVQQSVLVAVRCVVNTMPVFPPRGLKHRSNRFTAEQEAHFSVAYECRIAPVDGRDEHVFTVNNGALVVEFGDRSLVRTHDNGSGVVTFGEIPFLVHPVDHALDVLVEVRSVDNESDLNAPFSSVFKSGYDGVFSPTVGPIHVEVLQREENFFFGAVKHVHQFVDAVVRANEQGGIVVARDAARSLADDRPGVRHGPSVRSICKRNGRDVGFEVILVKGKVLEHHLCE